MTSSQRNFLHGAFEQDTHFPHIQPFNVMQWYPKQFTRFKPRITHPEDCGAERGMTHLGQIGLSKMMEIIKTKLTLPSLHDAFPFLENYNGDKWATSDQAQNPRSVAFVKVKTARLSYGKVFIQTHDDRRVMVPYMDISNFPFTHTNNPGKMHKYPFIEPTIRFSLSNPYKPDHETIHRCYLQCSMIIP